MQWQQVEQIHQRQRLSPVLIQVRPGAWYSQLCPNPDAMPPLALTLQYVHAGIGFVTSKELARQGYRVAMVCRDLEKGRAAKAQIL